MGPVPVCVPVPEFEDEDEDDDEDERYGTQENRDGTEIALVDTSVDSLILFRVHPLTE